MHHGTKKLIHVIITINPCITCSTFLHFVPQITHNKLQKCRYFIFVSSLLICPNASLSLSRTKNSFSTCPTNGEVEKTFHNTINVKRQTSHRITSLWLRLRHWLRVAMFKWSPASHHHIKVKRQSFYSYGNVIMSKTLVPEKIFAK